MQTAVISASDNSSLHPDCCYRRLEVAQGDRVGGADFDAFPAGGAADRDHCWALRGGAQGVLGAGAQACPARGAGRADPQRMQRGDCDGDLITALLGHDERTTTQVAGTKQGGSLSDAASTDVVPDGVARVWHLDGVELIGRIAM